MPGHRLASPDRAAVRVLTCLAALALLAACAGRGDRIQGPLPEAGAVYRDADPAARVPGPIAADAAATRALLSARLADHPDDADALVRRAWERAQQDDVAGAESDYAAALALVPAGGVRWRHGQWSRGWARLELGDDEGALESWRQSVRAHGGHPFWQPYTYPLALWRMGRAREAVAWYAQAAADQPGRWGTREVALRTAAHWTPGQRRTLDEVLAAWEAERAEGRGSAR